MAYDPTLRSKQMMDSLADIMGKSKMSPERLFAKFLEMTPEEKALILGLAGAAGGAGIGAAVAGENKRGTGAVIGGTIGGVAGAGGSRAVPGLMEYKMGKNHFFKNQYSALGRLLDAMSYNARRDAGYKRPGRFANLWQGVKPWGL